MAQSTTTPLTIADGAIRVSALLDAPPDARACYVFAHGAGAGMTHSFMTEAAEGLAERGIATLREHRHGIREIARRIGRAPSTVSRELRRYLKPHDKGVNRLLLPWPLRVRESDFRPIEVSVAIP